MKPSTTWTDTYHRGRAGQAPLLFGFSHTEAAELLGMTRRQADGVWILARAWLFKRIQPG